MHGGAEYVAVDVVLSAIRRYWSLALLVCCVAAACAQNPVRLPGDSSDPTTSTGDEAPDTVDAVSSDHSKVATYGWSFGSELDQTKMMHGNSVTLDPGNADIVLFFGSPGPTPSTMSYRYRLDGYDADWTETRNHSVHYRRLPPGQYHFEVQKRFGSGDWLASGVALPVEQKPFFYQTWYAYLIVGIGLVALTAQLLTQRDQLLKGQMGMVLDERNRIASECHDTLMAGFAAVSWQLEATSNRVRDSEHATAPVAESIELARSMVAHCQAEARRIIWDLRNSDRITNILSHALSDAIEAHRLRGSVPTTFDVSGDEVPISPAAVHHLVCIGQEAVTNAMRHAHSSKIQVGLRYDSDSLSLTVKDNGKGFHPDHSARSGHFGIPVMEERARKLGGSFRLTSSDAAGTEVMVTVSFQKIHQPTIQQNQIVPWIGV